MKIPATAEERRILYTELVASCFGSVQDRSARYNILRNWYLYGNNNLNQPTEYNKLFSHIDLYASYLFSGETTTFIIEIPDNADLDIDRQTKMAGSIARKVNEVWGDSNIDLTFNEALVWALVYDTAFVKLVPQPGGSMESYIVFPHHFGVLNEETPSLSKQEAFCHQYFIPKSQLERTIKNWSSQNQAEALSHLRSARESKQEAELPSAVSTLIINATTPTLEGNVKTESLISYEFTARQAEDGVDAYELWVWDDDLRDYRTIIMFDSDYVFIDWGKNIFLPNRIPFIKVTPNWMGNYFWGRSELMFLTPLQEWLNVRVKEIKEILAKIANPPTSAFGVEESKIHALMQAAGIAAFSDTPATMGKIEQHLPPNIIDLFKELQTIEQMFNEISGIKEIMRGGGESGVRAGSHADLLARLGSSRAKKKAFILEDAVRLTAELIYQHLRRNDKQHLKTKGIDGSFLCQHLTDAALVKVDAHSSSPIFLEHQMDKAQLLFDAGAIDEEDLIDAVRFNNANYIKSKLEKRKKAAAEAAAAEEAAKKKPQ